MTPDTPRKKRFPAIAIALTLLTLALILYVIWRLDNAPRTDDAYAYADTIDVVSEVNGKIINLPIRDNQAVKQGEVLFQIDPRPYQDALNRARAALVQLDQQIVLTQRSVNAQKYKAAAVGAEVERARAAARQATDTLGRMEPLLSQGFVTAEKVDQAKTAQHSAQAALEAALLQAKEAAAAVSGVEALVAQRAVLQAEIAMAEVNLEFTTVRAPFDGRVVSLKTSVGQFASALKPVFTLIDTRHWYVIANFRESELENIHPGTRSTVYLMTNSDEHFQGTVDSIGYGVLPDDGGSVIGGLPMVKRSINWVRVAQRFPVKILVENPDPDLFRIGASAVVVLHPAPSSHGKEQ
jgi:membrane fusion protein, multidrug efflux system